MHYEATRDMDSLNRATLLMKDSLEEVPKPDADLQRYATIYTELTRLKLLESNDLADLDNYISALHYELRFANGSFRGERLRQLGYAYFGKFSQSRNAKALRFAIKLLELNGNTLGDDRFLDTIYLGTALYHRFLERRSPGDLDKAIHLLRDGILSIPGDKPTFDSVKVFGLGTLRATCKALNAELPVGFSLNQMISSLEIILRSLEKLIPEFDQLATQLIHGLIRKLFQPMTADEINNAFVTHIASPHKSIPAAPSIPVYNWPGLQALSRQALSNNQTHIRLLELLPGRRDEPVKCSLAEVALNEVPSYEALSYVWGDPNDTVIVLINNTIFYITKNLHLALLRIRDPKSNRTLWIDSICIEQTDLIEKKHQIALMGDIYRQATSVILWLGEPQDSDLRHSSLGSESASSPDPGISLEASIPSISKSLYAVLPDRFEWLRPVLFGTKPALSNADSPDFQVPVMRSLIEALVRELDIRSQMQTRLQDERARNLPGPHLTQCDWTSMGTTAEYFKSSQTPDSWPLLGAFSLKDEELTYPATKTWIQSAEKLAEILANEYWDRVWIVQEVVLAKDPVLYLGPHIMSFETFVHGQKAFDIHYNNCCAKWGRDAQHRQFTWWTKIYDRLEKIRILAKLRESIKSANLDQGLDHGSANLTSLCNLLLSGIGTRKASNPRDLVYGLLGLVDDQKGIDVDYAQIDKVTEVSCMGTLPWQHPRKLVTDLKDWRRFAGLPEQSDIRGVFSDEEASFWRSVFADITQGKLTKEPLPTKQAMGGGGPARRIQTTDLHAIQQWWIWLQVQAENFLGTEWATLRYEQEFGPITNSFWESTSIRKLLKTSSGCIGSGPSKFGSIGNQCDVSPGDEIHAVFGCNLPVILRPVQSRESRHAYALVGMCYLQGIMDGEAVSDRRLEGNDIFLY
ncbi:heterokaryon incompatibility protein-domain-containing protein [Xylaria acuta]|nr:heterokaryon incompatibility protein-domain-containing protein [Xylaria acuta]